MFDVNSEVNLRDRFEKAVACTCGIEPADFTLFAEQYENQPVRFAACRLPGGMAIYEFDTQEDLLTEKAFVPNWAPETE